MIALIGLAAAVSLVIVLRWRARRAAERNRRRLLDAALGPTVDLVAVVLGSGGTIYQAVETVAALGPDPVRSTFRAALGVARSGELLADALVSASADLGPLFQPMIGALVATERDGAPLALLLQRLADDAQQANRWRIEALAKRLPVALLVPLVTCLLPAVVVGAVIPLVVISLRQLNL